MEEFKRLRFDGFSYGYFKTCKLKNNQTATIFFIRKELKRGTEYHVVFAISNKKKYIKQWILGERDTLTNKETGKCGLDGLIWAKEQIIEFEDYINIETYKPKDITICVTWTDNRRRNIYVRVLGKLGYKINYRNSCKCLAKKVA